MFYSRPKIEPLGWDLTAMPVPEGSRHHLALTSENRPVDFRFSGGWLTVERGAIGAPKETQETEEVLSVPIAPFGVMDIEPEQICDILGLTVNGRKIDSAGINTRARGFDWSGRTTYWLSSHMLLDGDDARLLVDILLRDFPRSVLIQPQWGSHGRARCRRVKFLLASDELVYLGMNWNRSRLEEVVSGREVSGELLGRVFEYSIAISRNEGVIADPTGAKYVHQNGGAELKYSVAHHRRYQMSTAFRTRERDSEEKTAKLVSILDSYFRRGLRIVNLATGAVITENAPDDTDEKSYSKLVYEKCMAEEDRYVFVSRSLPDNPFTPGESVFYGLRPTWTGR